MGQRKLYARVDANFDHNPKINEAGFWGARVFAFALRVNRREMLDGIIPRGYLTPGYLVRELNLTRDDCDEPMERMKRGIVSCVAAGLLAERDGEFVVVGYDEEWAGPKSSTERVRKHRQLEKQREAETPCNVSTVSGNAETPTEQNRSAQSRAEQMITSGHENGDPDAAASPTARRWKGPQVRAAKDIREAMVAQFGPGADDVIELCARIADSRKTGVSQHVLRDFTSELFAIDAESPAIRFGVKQILELDDGFDFGGRPSRIVNYVKQCVRSHAAGGGARRTSNGRSRSTGELLDELIAKTEDEHE